MTLRPVKTSLIIAGGYILICGIYIWLSGVAAMRISNSILNLHTIELLKGMAFILITGIVIFFFAYSLLIRIKRQHHELDMHRQALIESQARALTGTFAAGIAHDINNVLGAVNLGIDELREAIPDAQKIHLEGINTAFELIGDMSTRLMRVGKVRAEAGMREVAIVPFVHETVEFARRHKKLKPCVVQVTEAGAAAVLRINPYLVELMIINLMLNAADAAGTHGKIEIRVISRPLQVLIEVHDNGPGVDREARETLFKPYSTTKPDGTGLGLTTVKTCAEIHGGTVQVDASPLGGALFRIVLPVGDQTKEA